MNERAQPAWFENPNGLVTLRDIMKQLDLATVFKFGTACGHVSHWFSPIDVQFTEGPEKALSPEIRDVLTRHYSGVSEFCEAFGMPVSKAGCLEIIDLLKSEHTSKGVWLQGPTAELGKRIEAELKDQLFLYVSGDNAALYETSFTKWDQTCARYPSATFDIEEGSKCLALHRGTACVFHMMRVLELGLKSVVFALGITLEGRDRSWGKILNKVKEEIDRRNKSADSKWTPDRAFYEDACSSLHAVKDAWRNTTMHVEKVYNLDRAEHIYRMVRAFMEQLSTQLHE
jgi:hypothetical protein